MSLASSRKETLTPLTRARSIRSNQATPASVRPSVGLKVRPSVRPSARPSVEIGRFKVSQLEAIFAMFASFETMQSILSSIVFFYSFFLN